MSNTEPMADVVRDRLAAIKQNSPNANTIPLTLIEAQRVVDALASRPAPSEASGDVVEAAIDAACEAKCRANGFEFSILKHGKGIGANIMRKEVRSMLEAARPYLTQAPQADALFHLREIVDQAGTKYSRADGSLGSIEGDDGEQAWIVPHDPIFQAEAFLKTLTERQTDAD